MKVLYSISVVVVVLADKLVAVVVVVANAGCRVVVGVIMMIIRIAMATTGSLL